MGRERVRQVVELGGSLPRFCVERLCFQIFGNVITSAPFLTWVADMPTAVRKLTLRARTVREGSICSMLAHNSGDGYQIPQSWLHGFYTDLARAALSCTDLLSTSDIFEISHLIPM